MSNGFVFKKATKEQARLRMAIIGPAGTGKTYSALAVAQHLGKRVAVIDTERGSASKYAHKFAFDVLELDNFGPLVYVDALDAAAKAGYDVVIVDSLSHAWMGHGGALEQVDAHAKRSNSGNTFGAWRSVTPQHNAMVDALLGSPCHVIVTMRSKTDYVQEKDDRGKTVVRKVGLAPVQREGLEYEFDVVGEMTYENEYIISKSRCEELTGKVIPKPGAKLADAIKSWLTDGAPHAAQVPAPEPSAPKQNGAPAPHPATALAACVDAADAVKQKIAGLDFAGESETGRQFMADSMLDDLDHIEGLPDELRHPVVAELAIRWFGACASLEELDAAAAAIKKTGLANGSRKRAGEAYSARSKALKALAAHAAQPVQAAS